MPANKQAQRDHLIDRARYGEISGDEADAEADRLGLGRLSHLPGPEEFRPEREAHWTLPMAVAWIAYLDLDEVREWFAPYRDACWHWRWRRWRVGLDGPIHEGWHLEQRSKPTLSLLAISSTVDIANDEKVPAMSVADAQEALWIALREGFFVASGIDTEGGRRVEISALDWHELVPVQGQGEIDEVRFGPLGNGFRDVLLPSTALRGYWRKVEKPELILPALMAPVGDGYMPLYCAAQWIATEGGRIDFEPENESIWQRAYAELLAAISSERVRVVGTRGDEREPVPGHHFADCEIEYPFHNPPEEILWDQTLHLRSQPYLDAEHWRGGFDDALLSGFEPRWIRLVVAKEDVLARWPFIHSKERTGMAGRPALARHLILDELNRRGSAGNLAPTLVEQARELIEWLAAAHPDCARPSPGTTENNIREAYRRLKP